MKKIIGLMAAALFAVSLMTASASAAQTTTTTTTTTTTSDSASAASTADDTTGTNWETGMITVEGYGVAPTNARTAGQARILARRAAVVDAYRNLAEEIQGVSVDGETTVEDAMITSDIIKTKVSAFIKGARIVSQSYSADGTYVVTIKAPLFGAQGSVASAIFEAPATQEPFPLPVTPADGSSTIPYNPNDSTGSSASAAPSGKATGGYTGLIVDCTGLGLKPVMSPVIKTANGTPIYGYKNLNIDLVIANGMASYTTDINKAHRAGSNPLIVKAVSLDGHNANPVLSVSDANRVLIENGATGFLDRTNVVFLR